MKKAEIEKRLRYEHEELKKAIDFMKQTEGWSGPSCDGSANIGRHEGRISLLEYLLKEKTK